ncbi:glycosyltransferase family 4 protein [Thermosediminibacter litoriperuensis]|uniref:Glycosyltransferase involved in cell wall biosynthesis n=1 Tax=Thermosediminibacter litoriperuensis TaxID=291989 RepID=A0A5S5AWR7_9FIRM|nr:glycosyltransferase family 4 protein [Thermosediminibacter litoriperuensis]TYP57805.1 glycosyltransferase involved in cell wall biosynthesis [Thermosediminibacter litoriperuensis]
MNLAILSTYPPRECGIASFAKDLRDNLTLWGQNVKILAITDNEASYSYPQEVAFELQEEKKDDFIASAEYVNATFTDVVILEHEYGIFGGCDGSYVLDFVARLKKPFILNTHTVLSQPTIGQKSILMKLGRKAAAVICMTRRSAELLHEVYRIPLNKIYVVPHGVPIFPEKPREKLKEAYGVAGRPVVTTFGFIGPGKGIELGIRAVANLKEKYPNIVYWVVGETHPKLKRREGEVYRESLEKLVDSLKLHENVRFANKYLSLEELGDFLYMTDVYLTPYPGRHQAVSGTLSYAIGCGRAIVSTPYEYSLEMLANGRGLVASGADSAELARLIEMVLNDPLLKSQLEKKAAKLGKTMTWPLVAKSYVEIIEEILRPNYKRRAVKDV